ncbi:MAG: NAD(P)H-dependent glycerol-3-phosphate dehydrogenase [Pseudotabrizicola sp.]|uniref:NAD(P)H-dependent glycerol-3-phosphate dehydrogenase n=1 Tax=Pseudotabrizicola sp. TaxID=2939647 RepID=UPI0027301FCF|nr:NAD(P)H-dependent glycerol-3-phosphate dehydrogenase [Pseudotabrizicola sp.]MDP2080505.1 NAD(P)H-dependent glycerol-3-phosphate dehydrogenase [Pseudotabrizicola sp.]MDZ7575230.1 NAD(P)H-dependent glycerol-3-phosphate dehydrogenase [Pseudotabrizicola sp.]
MTASIGIIGAGAFGAALAIALARQGRDVRLWARDAALVDQMAQTRTVRRLPEAVLPKNVSITADLAALSDSRTILLSVPMQALGAFLAQHSAVLTDQRLVACCKGMDLTTRQGPTALIAQAFPDATPMILTGPSFAADIAKGQATALTLACADDVARKQTQEDLSGQILRIYRNTDVIGAELGGALKNVIAIAAGIVVGAGLGESARAALMTRGFAEMVRFATRLGAKPETLMGLSGFGDLVLTCTSDQSRNFRHGLALGRGESPDATQTVEGVATAQAILQRAMQLGVPDEIPVTAMVTRVTTGQIAVYDAIHALMSRPLKEE